MNFRDLVSHAGYWSERYKHGQTGWDMKQSTPVFRALLSDERYAHILARMRGEKMPDSTRESNAEKKGVAHAEKTHHSASKQGETSISRLILPGCGFGYDAILFSKAGFAVTAVDFAPEPLAFLRDMAWHEHCDIDIVHGDIFDLGREQSRKEQFDVCVEYTCYCAINPARRAEYFHAIARMLKPGGLLVALLFPLDQRADGPPFAVSAEEALSLAYSAGLEYVYRDIPSSSHPARAGNEELFVWEKKPF